jgi:hypothetical protein
MPDSTVPKQLQTRLGERHEKPSNKIGLSPIVDDDYDYNVNDRVAFLYSTS